MQTKKSNKIFLSNTEKKLKNDVQGEYRNKIINSLLEEALRIRELKQKGASPENFLKLENILVAIVASMEVVDQRWKKFHEAPANKI